MLQETLSAGVLNPILDRVRANAFTLREIGQSAPARKTGRITEKRIADHLAGEHIIGVYPMPAGSSTTQVALLDLDSHKGETAWPEMMLDALRIMDALEAELLSPIPFRSSGGQGIHIYLLWDDPQDAHSVRETIASVLSTVGFFNGTKGVAHREVEIFPKQDSVGADRYGNMFVLPLAGKSNPLSVETLDDLPRIAIARMEWPTSAPVRVHRRPETVSVGLSQPQQDYKALAQALDAIPNNDIDPLSYEDWRNVIFAIHDATGGSDAGREMAHNFSAKCGKNNAAFLEERVWPYVRSERDSVITINTVFNIAARYGWVEDLSERFPVLPVTTTARTPEAERPWPKLERDKKGILATVENLAQALSHPGLCEWYIATDTFTEKTMIAPSHAPSEWQNFTDTDNFRLRMTLGQRGFYPIPKDLMRDAVNFVAERHSFDSAQVWLGALQWDGKPRCHTYLSKYFGCEDNEYTRAASDYLWTAMAGRVLAPGIKADMVVVLSGSEGLQKTAGIAAMVPSSEYFTELAFSDKDAENSRKIRGTLVAELAELRGLQSRDAESILAFVTRTHEEWRPLYSEHTKKYARRLVMIGTTNEDDFLDGSRRNRRWLPMVAGRVNLNAIRQDRALLWAEAAELFKKNGVLWQDAESLGKAEVAKFAHQDEWEHDIARWLAEEDLGMDSPRGAHAFMLRDVMASALNLSMTLTHQSNQRRVGAILKKLGYVKKQMWHEGRNTKMWCDPMV